MRAVVGRLANNPMAQVHLMNAVGGLFWPNNPNNNHANKYELLADMINMFGLYPHHRHGIYTAIVAKFTSAVDKRSDKAHVIGSALINRLGTQVALSSDFEFSSSNDLAKQAMDLVFNQLFAAYTKDTQAAKVLLNGIMTPVLQQLEFNYYQLLFLLTGYLAGGRERLENLHGDAYQQVVLDLNALSPEFREKSEEFKVLVEALLIPEVVIESVPSNVSLEKRLNDATALINTNIEAGAGKFGEILLEHLPWRTPAEEEAAKKVRAYFLEVLHEVYVQDANKGLTVLNIAMDAIKDDQGAKVSWADVLNTEKHPGLLMGLRKKNAMALFFMLIDFSKNENVLHAGDYKTWHDVLKTLPTE